jgi:quinolinate synthase
VKLLERAKSPVLLHPDCSPTVLNEEEYGGTIGCPRAGEVSAIKTKRHTIATGFGTAGRDRRMQEEQNVKCFIQSPKKSCNEIG